MKISEKALLLTKKFAAGAPCPVNFKNIEATMFWPHYEAIATRMGLTKIITDVVKEYWFKIHNGIVLKRFQRGDLKLLQAENCMVRSGKRGKRLFCFHGGRPICPITKEEAKTIKQHTPKLTRTPR